VDIEEVAYEDVKLTALTLNCINFVNIMVSLPFLWNAMLKEELAWQEQEA
jgi:hypothetical protein